MACIIARRRKAGNPRRGEEIPPLFGPSQQYQKHYANDAAELERSFETKAHSEKSMNVSDMNVTDEDDFLSRSVMIKANNKIICHLKEDQSEFLEERRLKDLVNEFAALTTSESVSRYTGTSTTMCGMV